MKAGFMKLNMPEKTAQAIRYLLQTAAEDGVTVAGFAFIVTPPAITSFGNCPDHASLKLYEILCRMYDAKDRMGLVITDDVERMN